jgi:osmotically-inducible protein OsmY
MLYKKMLAVVAAAACAGLAGCDNTAQGVKEDARENKAAAEQQAAEAKAKTADERADVKEAGRDAGNAIQEAGRDVGNAAAKAGDAVAGAAKDAGSAVHAGKQTLDVKSALLADASVDATHIDVDTDDATKTVTLKGTVPNAAQKAAAERIARDKAAGYKIRNTLTIAKP